MKQIESAIKNLGHTDTEVRTAAKIHLLSCGTIALPYLEEALVDSEPSIIAEVAYLMGQYGKDADRYVKALLAVSYINDTNIRVNAIKSIGLIAEKSEVCIPVLERHLLDEDTQVRKEAMEAIGNFDAVSYHPLPESENHLQA